MRELEPYLRPDFDPVEYSKLIVSDCSKRGNSSTSLSASLAKLEEHQATVESTISAHIAQNNDALRDRLSKSVSLKDYVHEMKVNANALSASLDRISRDILEPYASMQSVAQEMRKMQQASSVLRKVLRFLSAARKLKAQLKVEAGAEVVLHLPKNVRDLAKSAQVLHDVEDLMSLEELDGIEVVAAEAFWVKRASEDIRKQARAALEQAIQTLNQTEVGASLQAFFNLRCLPESVDNSLSYAVESLLGQVKELLDVHSLADDIQSMQEGRLGGAAANGDRAKEKMERKKVQKLKKKRVLKPPKGQEEEWNNTLWTRVEKMETSIRSWSLRIWNLERVLAKKRDPATRVVFADSIAAHSLNEWKALREKIGAEAGDHPKSVYVRYWDMVTQELEQQFDKAIRGSPYMRTALGVRSYPKMRKLMRQLLFKLKQSTSGKSVPPVGGSSQEAHALLQSLRPFLEVYLARSLHRLTEPVNLMFPEGQANAIGSTNYLPSAADISTFCSVVREEVAAAEMDAELAMAICKGASKALTLFAVKAEQLVVMDRDAAHFRLVTSVSSSATNSSAGTRSLAEASAASNSTSRTAAQAHNVALLGLIVRLHRVAENLPEETTKLEQDQPFVDDTGEEVLSQKRTALSPALTSLKKLVELILGYYLSAAARALEQILARVHRENFTSGSKSAKFVSKTERMEVDRPSSYMNLFEEALKILKKEHLDKLPDGYPVVDALKATLQARIVAVYVRHIAMVRPLDGKGRAQLFFDMSHFETLVSDLGEKSLQSLGEVYEEFQAMKKLLLFNPEESINFIGEYKTFLSNVKLPTLLNFIFSTAPAELRSPHDQLKMSPERFSEWMDKAEFGEVPTGLRLLEAGSRRESSLNSTLSNLVRSELDRYVQRKSVRNQELQNSSTDDGLSEEYHILTALIDP